MATPPIVSRLPLRNACAVAGARTAKGPFAFVACQEDGVWGIDLASPAQPIAKGTLTFEGMDARRLWADRQRLLVAAFGNGLHAYDIRDPHRPLHLAHLASAAIPYVENVVGWGSWAFVVGGDGVNARFAAVDARNPRFMSIAGVYTHVGGEPLSYTSVAFDGRVAFVGTSNGEVHVLDLSNLSRVRRIGEHFCARNEFRRPSVGGLVWSQGRLYVCDLGAGLEVLDAREPSVLRRLGGWDGGAAGSNVFRASVDWSNVVLANGWGGLVGIDAADPSAMRVTFEVSPRQASFVDVAVVDRWVLGANNGVPQGLDVVQLR